MDRPYSHASSRESEGMDRDRLAARLYGSQNRVRLASNSPNPVTQNDFLSTSVSTSQLHSGFGLVPSVTMKKSKSSSTMPDAKKRMINMKRKKRDSVTASQLSSIEKRRLLHPVAVARNLDRNPPMPRTLEPLDGRAVMEANQAWGANDVTPGKLDTDDDDADNVEMGQGGTVFPTFTASLQLDARYMDEFLAGNFLYLRPKAGMGRTAYDLETAEHYETNPDDYYTMSRAGITHFTSSDSDFTSLDQWEREYYLFNMIRRIPFFAKYRVWKNFTEWKRNVRASKVKGSRDRLQRELFLFIPALRDALMSLRRLCFETGHLRLVGFDAGVTYSLESFCERQLSVQQAMTVALGEFSEDVRSLVRTACDEVIDGFLKANAIVADHKMTFMERAALRTECRKLTKFLRLSDFLVIDTLRALALDSVSEIAAFVKQEGVVAANPDDSSAGGAITTSSSSSGGGASASGGGGDGVEGGDGAPASTPLFTVQVSFHDEGSLFVEPAADQFKENLENVILESLHVIGVPERVLGHEELSAYVMAESDDAEDGNRDEVSLEAIVMADEAFERTTEQIYLRLEDAFRQVLAYAQVFEPYKATWLENNAYRANVTTIHTDVDLDVYVEHIEQYQAQTEEFEEIPGRADIGIMRVDSGDLRLRLMPSPVQCLLALRELLPQLMEQASRSLLDHLAELLPIVTATPTEVEAFVNKTKTLMDVAANLTNLKARQAKIKSMGRIMDDQGWAVPDEDKANIVMVAENMTTLENGMQASEGRIEEDTKIFAQTVADEIPGLNKKVLLVREKLDDSIIADSEAIPDDVISFLKEQEVSLMELKDRSEKLREYQSTLKQPVEDYETLDEVVVNLGLKLRLWTGIRDWAHLTGDWVSRPFLEVDATELSKQVMVYNKTCLVASKSLPANPAVTKLKKSVESFKPILPVIVDLRNPALKQRHWDKIHSLVGFQIEGVEGLTLGNLLELNVTDFVDEISTVATAAQQECVLEDMLAKVSKVWVGAELEVNPYKDVKDLYVLGSVEDIVAALDDSLVTINTVLGSRFVAGIRDEVETWQQRLVLLQDTLDEWVQCQRTWMYLENIFGSPDIQRQLPVASKTFDNVDKSWRDIMMRTADEPNAIKSGTVAGLKETLHNHNIALDKIQKGLEDFLETKRAAFPRFYFLSNDELLEIMAQAKNPQAVQPHLRKCFDNLVKLDFGDDPASVDIHAMYSSEGERVPLGRNLKARGDIERWLTEVESNMKAALHKLMKAALLDYDTRDRDEWVMQHPGQCVATAAQMTWARDTERALREEETATAMEAWYETSKMQLGKLIGLIRGDLSKIERKIIVALVTTDVHARDIVEQLVEDRVESVDAFTWQQQLRYYWDLGLDDCLIRHSDSVIRYGYEYMGATSRLVITPLTDRCWMTLTGSFGLKLGAAPAGPAGTGKTESSKDLAKAMGILCIVFNCSDQIDYNMMGKLFRGLAQAGCWTCLDEFNRIDIEVLSVIAQQLLVLREGRLEGKSHMNFMGTEISLKDHHVIVTMNPGYAGRTELPDNLAVCFRPVSMMVPDYALIAEIMLFAEGFGDAKSLSRKMCKLYILSSEQLSQQPHYDYGLRAVKSVLVMAGSLKRANPTLDENVTLIRALRDSNVPKFLSEDLPLFFAILGDLFPGVEVPYNDYGELQVVLEEEIVKMGKQRVGKFITKVIQLYDVFNVRFGACVVGPTGAGKTTCYRVLQNTMTTLRERGSSNPEHETVEATVLNPKCITMGELYGEFNALTQEWHDGLASTIMRRAAGDDSVIKKWTVFDGPIDALWIENMNTVLDDNMTLCLANGERIKLRQEMKMLFEVMDLAVASPATVSRIGVLYMTPGDLGWLPYVQSWVAELPEEVPTALRAYLLGLFEKTVEKGLEFLRTFATEPVATVDIQAVASLCSLFASMYTSERGVDFGLGEEVLKKITDRLFAFSYIWSVGGTMTVETWEDFDVFAREMFEDASLSLGMPTRGLVFDYFFDVADRDFQNWSSIVPSFEFSKDVEYFKLMVPTVDTVRYSFVMTQLLRVRKPVFVTGVTGTGKTSVVQDMFNRLQPSKEDGGLDLVPMFINFSAQTSSLVTQSTIEGKLEKKRKTLLGAPAGKLAAIFVDDVNMPFVEEYGAQAPIELLRQFLDFSGFYDRDKLFWKDVVDTVLFVGAAPPGGGRNHVTPRFTRHFNVLCMQPASTNTLSLIFGSILGGFYDVTFRGSQDVKNLKDGVVDSTIEVYNRISAELLPTPARFHYTFNLRDISKVFQGILMIQPKKCPNADVMTRLWLHESMRVFYDRLINNTDKQWFQDLCVELLNRYFRANTTFDVVFGGSNMLMFGDYMKPGMEIREYEETPDLGKVASLLDDYLEEYNVSNANQMKLVFFTDAVKHVSRISRILRQPRGNAMLVGVGGSGKQSLSRLAASMAEYQLVQVELVRGYGLNEFREDLKKMMILAGVQGKHTVFLFTDTQIVEESFLEDVNNVLNSGEVPNLFPPDELEKVIGDMRPVLKDLGIPESRDLCYSTFVARVRDRLHIVLAMSPVGDALRVRCRQFPSLINCTTIDWFMEWPREALVSVASRFLKDLELPSEEVREGLVEMCGDVHTSISATSDKFFEELRRKVYTTPKSYLDLINLYLSVLAEKRTELNKNRRRMESGVTKLDETNSMVEGLKEDLTKLAPELEIKSAAAEQLLEQVAVEQISVRAVQERVGKDEAEVQLKAEEVGAIQADAQKDLDVAMPALNNAIKALDSLSKGDITEVKSFAKPPEAVMVVMEAVCVLLAQKPDWDTAKKLLGDSSFIDKLKGYDKDNIPAAVLKKLRKYTDDPRMAVESVKKVSKAATSLCMWAHAMDVYSKVAKEVGPKRKRLEEANAVLNDANAKLATKQAELKAVNDRMALLQKNCDDTLAEKNYLAEEAERTKARLVRAEKLTAGLEAEGIRWKETIKTIDRDMVNLIGDVFLSSACISYIGPFTGPYRERLIGDWQAKTTAIDLPCSNDYTLLASVGSPVMVRDWQLNGLPSDPVSTDNGILVTRGKRWPLMIDPQGQANKWIKNTEAKSNLETTVINNVNLLRSLENCIRVGRPLLIEDIGETLEAALEPVLQKAIFKQGGRLLIHLGDSDVDYDPNFRMYITTKMPNPHYLPEVCIKVTVINFTVTMGGLEDQLLGDVVRLERPDIEERKNKLLLSMAADKKQLHDIEAKILKMLSESSGDILDDEELINTLADSKTTSGIIKERVEESERTQIDINEAREGYRTVATRGSIIYFVIADLASIDPMYQYSLEYYARLFNNCIQKCAFSPDLEERLANLIEYITEIVYVNICRGLFESHKTLFAALICFQILRHAEYISPVEWQLLLRGPGVVDRTDQLPNPAPARITEQQWDLLYGLEHFMVVGDEDMPFEGLAQSITEQWEEWSHWMECVDPISEPVPQGYEESINGFQRLALIKAFREDKVLQAIQDFVGGSLGKKFVEAPSATMEEIYRDLDSKTPCIFILSTGADPTSMLLRFAKEFGYIERLSVVSLGQGQGPLAQSLMERAGKSGDWVLLQNCMLAKSWMPTLEQLVADLPFKADLHTDFRLYLTSAPASYFPVTVLQIGVKMTNEPPKGIRANLLRSYNTLVKEDQFETCKMSRAWKKLLFGLAMFHALVQERRKFGPLGWNIRYAFDDSDLETSIAVLRRFLEEQDEVPWDALRYVTGQINYGGRVTDDWDRRCLMSVLGRLITDKVLDDDYKFSDSGTYYAPFGSLSRFKEYITGLPMIDDPEIFGMHANANVTFEKNESNTLLLTILNLQPRTSGGGGGGMSNDDIVLDLVADVKEHIPDELLMSEAGSSTFVVNDKGLLDSLATVLGQELVKFNRLIQRCSQTLVDLGKAIKGLIVMSSDLDLMYTKFLNNQVPDIWTSVSFASLKGLASWVKDLKYRVAFMREWLVNGQPRAFPLPVFFFPQGFMTGTLQNFARKYQVAIDSLRFRFNVLDGTAADIEAGPEDGVYVFGLWMEGARWHPDRRLMARSRAGEMYVAMPPIHFIPAENYKSPKDQYQCPVYKTSVRKGALSTTGMSTNFVVAVDLPTDVDPDVWVLNGVGFLCNLDD